MRKFHLKRNPLYSREVNIDRLWSLMPEGVYEKAKETRSSEVAPIIDVTKLVLTILFFLFFFDYQYRLIYHNKYQSIGIFQGSW